MFWISQTMPEATLAQTQAAALLSTAFHEMLFPEEYLHFRLERELCRMGVLGIMLSMN